MGPVGSLAEALHEGTVVLDGGLATQLEAAGHDLGDELWSARLLRDDPEAIVAAHLAFLRAGASVVTTASYQATIPGFAKRGVDGASALRSSVALARQACARAGVDRPLWVAASVGPYGAMLADGSEYRGNYGLSVAELVAFHRPRLEILASAEPDVFALETCPDTREAEALLRALDGIGIPAWLSFTVAGDRTRAGQPLATAFGLATGVDALIAVGVNCCDPRDVRPAIRLAVEVTGKPAVAYPNSGETWDATARTWTGPRADDWLPTAARLVGGCCRVMPADIAAIAGRL
jgi:homocysteine S-methyltransferase